MNEIEDWYDNKYDEWSRLDRHRIEFEITKRYMDEFIKGSKLNILDIGGGPGRYSFYLAEKGHQVTLLDLSQNNINIAKEKSKEYGIELKGYIKGNALELDSFEEQYDVVLLMGPLYHLIHESDRKRAVEGALRLLKKDGLMIASFISRYAPIQDCLTHLEFYGFENDEEALLSYLKNGEKADDLGFTTAYFTGIEEAQALMNGMGLEQLAFAGVENILGSKEKEILSLKEEKIMKWFNLGFKLSQDKNLLGASQHFLYIGKKI